MMGTRVRGVLLALALAAALVDIGSQPALAGDDESFCDQLKAKPEDIGLQKLCTFEHLENVFGPPITFAPGAGAGAAKAAVTKPHAFVERLVNVGGTTQPGEPTQGGSMTRTGWFAFKAPAAERIVIHTFGSEAWDTGVFDPVLAIYRGTALSNLVRVATNDNRALAGISAVDSLVQFNTVAGAEYRVQIGGKNQVEGIISLNVFRFPPSGGLSAFLLQSGGTRLNGRDYSCDFYTGPAVTTTCPSAKFIVHNSTDSTLAVTPTTSLGAGVTASPASFNLLKGGLKVVTFTFGAAFNHTTVRAASGAFIFTGRTGATVVSEARQRALVIARPAVRVTDLITVRTPLQVQTAHTNVPVSFTPTVTNTGVQNAIGCHFRSVDGSNLRTTFYTINPSTGARLTADNAPVNIAAGQSRTFKVTTASQGLHDADTIDPDVIADCANNFRSELKLRGGFDISTWPYADRLPALGVSAVAPAGGVLNVPATGFAYFTFRARNTTTSASLAVLPAYVGPFDDPANTRYTVAICRTNISTGVCVASYASSVTYIATKGTVFGFSVRVKAPTGAPAFDPDRRRVVVNVKAALAPYLHIAAPSIAVKKL